MCSKDISLREVCEQWEVDYDQLVKWQQRDVSKKAVETRKKKKLEERKKLLVHYNRNWFGGKGNSCPDGILEVPLTVKQMWHMQKQVEGLMATIRNHDDKIHKLGHKAANPHEFAGSYWEGRRVRHLHNKSVGVILKETTGESGTVRTFAVGIDETVDAFLRARYEVIWRFDEFEFVHPDKDPMEDLRGSLDRAKRRIKELECFRAETREKLEDLDSHRRQLANHLYDRICEVSAHGRKLFNNLDKKLEERKENPVHVVDPYYEGRQVRHDATGRTARIVREADYEPNRIRLFNVRLDGGGGLIVIWRIDKFTCMAPDEGRDRTRVAPTMEELRSDMLHAFNIPGWDATGRRGAMPQAGEYGLRLPTLSPAEVLWKVG